MRRVAAFSLAGLVMAAATPTFAGEFVYRRSVTRATTHTTVVREMRKYRPHRHDAPRYSYFAAPPAPGYLTERVVYNAPAPVAYQPVVSYTPEVSYAPVVRYQPFVSYQPTVSYRRSIGYQPVWPGCGC